MVSSSQKVVFFMIFNIFFFIFFRSIDFSPTSHQNFTSLSHLIYFLHLLNLKNLYLYTNRQSPQNLILVSRSQKVVFFMILSMEISVSNFFDFFSKHWFFLSFIWNSHFYRTLCTLFISYTLKIQTCTQIVKVFKYWFPGPQKSCFLW